MNVDIVFKKGVTLNGNKILTLIQKPKSTLKTEPKIN